MKRNQILSLALATTLLSSVLVGGLVGVVDESTTRVTEKTNTNVVTSGQSNAHTAVGAAVGYADKGTIEAAVKSGAISGATVVPVSVAACSVGPQGCAFGAGYTL